MQQSKVFTGVCPQGADPPPGQTPPSPRPKQMATAEDGMHPAGILSCSANVSQKSPLLVLSKTIGGFFGGGRGAWTGAHPGPIFFVFLQFLGILSQIVSWRPHLGNTGSATDIKRCQASKTELQDRVGEKVFFRWIDYYYINFRSKLTSKLKTYIYSLQVKQNFWKQSIKEEKLRKPWKETRQRPWSGRRLGATDAEERCSKYRDAGETQHKEVRHRRWKEPRVLKAN